MLANNVQESSTTTGTGNFTLSGSSEGGRTFSSEFITNLRFSYSIFDDNGNEEHGIGYLSDSTTLVREYVEDGSNGNSLVNFPAGTKQILCTRQASDSSMPLSSFAPSGTNNIIYPPFFVSYSTNYTERDNQLYLAPWRGIFKGNITNWAFYVKNASVGGVIRAGIYQVDQSTGQPFGDPIYESDNIPCDSTGLVTSPMADNTINPSTTIKLPDNFFMAVAFSDTTISVAAASYTNSAKEWVGTNENGAMPAIRQSFTLGTPTQGVAALPTITALTRGNENYPIGGFN